MKKNLHSFMHVLPGLRIFCLFAFILMPNMFFMPAPGNRKEKIENALKKGKVFLLQVHRTDGAIRDTANPLFETWETILASRALFSLGMREGDSGFSKAIQFLRRNENDKGLVCHNRKCKNAYCLETSAAYFSLLIQMGKADSLKKGISSILPLEKASGQWAIGNPDVKEETEFPSVTAFVLNVLAESGQRPLFEEQSISWLLGMQIESAHWGSAWEYYVCPAYAFGPV